MEILAGAWMIKNSAFSMEFLHTWLSLRNYTPNADNGALHMALLKLMRPGSQAMAELTELYEKAIQQQKTSLTAYFDFLRRFARLRDHRYSWAPHLKIKPPLQGYVRLMEERVSVYRGDLWSKYIGNELMLHTKNLGIYLNSSAALCDRPDLVAAHLLPDSPQEAARRIASSDVPQFSFYGWYHEWIRKCSPNCPELDDYSPWAQDPSPSLPSNISSSIAVNRHQTSEPAEVVSG
jgi:hypothetical protein